MRNCVVLSFVCLLVGIHYITTEEITRSTLLTQDPITETEIMSQGKPVATNHDYPHQVSLQMRSNGGNWSHFCGGAIIGRKIVLTNVYCGKQIRKFKKSHSESRVVAGAFNIVEDESVHQNCSVDQVHIHPNYDNSKVDFDFALIQVNEHWDLGKNVSTIQLPVSNEDPPAQSTCMSTGWGKGHVLLETELSNISSKSCKDAYDGRASEHMICAYSPQSPVATTCFEEDGAPLVCNNKLVGIASWSKFPCTKDSPGVFSHVSHAVPWINRIIQ